MIVFRYSGVKEDALVKSPPSRHSREGGSPEVLKIPGFPFSREWRKRGFSDFLRGRPPSFGKKFPYENSDIFLL